MAYVINKYSGVQLVVLQDGTLDTTTSLGLVGKNYTGYGEIQNENFLFLLENFANNNPPGRALTGQLWFSTESENLNVYDGENWKPVGSAEISETQPVSTRGALWFKATTDQLYIFDGDFWQEVGPTAVEGSGRTKLVGQSVLATDGSRYPILCTYVDDQVILITSSRNFTIDPTNLIVGFDDIVVGTNISNRGVFKGTLQGSAESAAKLSTPRLINGIPFDGQQNITVRSQTIGILQKGDYILGSNFDGTSDVFWRIDASESNQPSKIVARDIDGNFEANVITATLAGNVEVEEGTSYFNIISAKRFVGATLTGNAFSATRLETPRRINNVLFDGSADVTIPTAAEDLSGTRINFNVVESALTSVGVLTALSVRDQGITIGDSQNISLKVISNTPVIQDNVGNGITFKIKDSTLPGVDSDFSFINRTRSVSLGGLSAEAFIPDTDNTNNLGHPAAKWSNGYINTLHSSTVNLATINTVASNNNITINSNLTITGDLLVSGTSTTVNSTQVNIRDIKITLASGATNSVQANGAGINIAGSNAEIIYASTGDRWESNKSIAIISPNTFIGNLTGSASLNVAKGGDTMSGFLTLHANPTSSMHAATKSYVDANSGYTITYGNTQYSTSGFTNQVGSWNFGRNHFDVFPPSGKSMGNLVAFMPSIAVIHYAGGVDGNDSLVCTWSNLGDRIRVYVQNTEQRSTPAANWIAFWR
jgi:hypothetical protein